MNILLNIFINQLNLTNRSIIMCLVNSDCSSLAPHAIRTPDTPSSLAPSKPLDRSIHCTLDLKALQSTSKNQQYETLGTSTGEGFPI